MSQIEAPFLKINTAPSIRLELGNKTLPHLEFAKLWQDQVDGEAEEGAAPDFETSISALEPDTGDVVTESDTREDENERGKNPVEEDSTPLSQDAFEVGPAKPKVARMDVEVRPTDEFADDADSDSTDTAAQIKPDFPAVNASNHNLSIFLSEKGIQSEIGEQQKFPKGQSAAEGLFTSRTTNSLTDIESQILNSSLPPVNRLFDRIVPKTEQDTRIPMQEATSAPIKLSTGTIAPAPIQAESSSPPTEPKDFSPRNQAHAVVQSNPIMTGSMPAAAPITAQPVLGMQSVTLPNDIDSKLAAGLPEDAPLLQSGSAAPSRPLAFVSAPNTPTHAPQIAAQIVAAVVRSDAGTTEIRLNPDELGRVRIALTSTEAGMTVTILAERFETADLLRRNIETLAQEFRDIGYEDLVFEFDDSADDSSDSNSDQQTKKQTTFLEQASSADLQTQTIAALRGGLDLKL